MTAAATLYDLRYGDKVIVRSDASCLPGGTATTGFVAEYRGEHVEGLGRFFVAIPQREGDWRSGRTLRLWGDDLRPATAAEIA